MGLTNKNTDDKSRDTVPWSILAGTMLTPISSFQTGWFYPFLEWQILRASLLILTACQTFPLTGPPKQVLNYLTLKVCGVQTELLFLFHPILVLPKKYLSTWAMQIQTKTIVLYPDVPCLLIQPSSNPPLYTFNTASKCFSCYFTLLYNVTSI